MTPDIQIDEGDFTRLHNTILEKLALARFTASEYRCLMFLFRKTYGWQKKEDVISLGQWAEGTGIELEHRRNVLRTLQGLLAKGVIYAKGHDNNHAATWGFNKHFEDWDASLFESTVVSPDNTLEGQSVVMADNTLEPSVVSPDNSAVVSPDNSAVVSPDNSAVVTGDNNKRKIKETIKESFKEIPRARSRSGATHPNTQPIMDAYIEACGYTPGNYSKESSAAKKLAKNGYQPADVAAAYSLIKSEPFWRTKHLSLQTILEQIPALQQALLNGAHPSRAPTGYMNKGERQNAAVEEAFRILDERGYTGNER